MRDSVPSPRYSAICNVLRQWKTSLIPTYRVYRLYDKEDFAQQYDKCGARSGSPQFNIRIIIVIFAENISFRIYGGIC